MKDVMKNIQIGSKESLKGNLAKSHRAVIIISTEVKTPSLPKGTSLPALMHCKIDPAQGWDRDMQVSVCDFIISRSGQGKVLVCSDGGDSRAVAVIVRLLIKLGFQKKDAVAIAKDRTGSEPAPEILGSFPDIDEKRASVTLPGGKNDARHLARSIDLTEKEVAKIK